MSFVYERGWRQGFSWAGFPGAIFVPLCPGCVLAAIEVRDHDSSPGPEHEGFADCCSGVAGADVEYNYAIDYLLPVGGEV